MGIRLVVEVLDYAPADLTPAERLVLVVIAEKANDDTRLAYPGIDLIGRRTGLKPKSLSELFRRLARRQPPLELRMPVMTGRDGRPVYAHEKHQTVYRVPILRPRQDGPSIPTGPATVGPPNELEAPPQPPRGPATVAERPRSGGALSLTDPSLIPQTTYVGHDPDAEAPLQRDLSPAKPSAPKSPRGTRVPDDFTVTPDMRTWYREHTPDVDIAIETAKFVDYWRAATGAKAVKADWTAAWRTWMRNAEKWQAERTSNGHANGRASGANRHVDQLTPDQRAARNPFATAIRASQVTPGSNP